MPVQKKSKEPVQKSKGVSVSNAGTKLDADRPIPFEGGQVFSSNNNSFYLPFLSPTDNFAQVLLEASLLSTTQSACIETKRDFCAGEDMEDVDGKELDQSLKDWFNSMNIKDESASEINRQIFESHFMFGNTPIEVVRYSLRNKKDVFIYVHNFLEWRLCPPNDEGVCTHAIQSKLFIRNTRYGVLTAEMLKSARKLPIYNPRARERDNWVTDSRGTQRTIIWYKNTKVGYLNYGMPSAVASLIFQILEYKGARFNLDDFENGMVISAILALKGNISQEEAQKIARSIINTHTGDGKRGRVSVVASEEGIDDSSFHQMDTTKDGSYIQSDGLWTQKIIFAHKWDAILAGLVSPSTLGKGEGFLTKLFEIKGKTVRNPAQAHLMKNVWINIFKIAKEWAGLPTDKFNIGIKSSANIGAIMDVDITPAVTVDEVRIANGHPALEDKKKGAMLLGEIKSSQQKDPNADPNKKGGKEDV
jgi:hypothetical protein